MDNIPPEVPLLRITFVGMTNAGKTTIINRLCNNRFLSEYIPTDEPEFYYYSYPVPESLELGRTDLITDSNVRDFTEVMLELEDMYGAERTDGERDIRKEAFIFKRNEDAAEKYREHVLEEREATPFRPFSFFPNTAISANRMCYVYVFALDNKASLTRVIALHSQMKTALAKQARDPITTQGGTGPSALGLPIQILYGTKEDVCDWELKDAATSYAGENGMKVFFGSSKRSQDVKDLFLEAIKLILPQKQLWRMLPDDDDDDD